MENTVHPEPELEKHEESMSEGTSMQSNEPTAKEKKDAPIDPLKKLQDELAEAKDKYVRLYAEFDNFRRRNAKEKLELISSANEQLLKALLPVVDDFDRAEKSFKNKNDKEAEGFFLIQNKFKKILDQFSVKAMEIPQGSDFNADLHEAITQIPAPEEKLKGKVVDVVEKGYLLGEKVIRFAKVVIGN
jgi:molecular chaperone GrpE